MRKAFNHYYSIHEIKKQLNDSQYLQFDKALCKVQFLEIHIDSVSFKDPLLNLLWVSIKHTIKSNIEGYCSKMKINYESLFDGLNDSASDGGCQGSYDGGCQQEKEKEKEQYSSKFITIWDWYKRDTDRPIGDKAKAYKSYLKHLKKLDDATIQKCVYNYVQECKASNSFTKHLATFLNSDIEEYNYVPNVQKTATKKQEDEILI